MDAGRALDRVCVLRRADLAVPTGQGAERVLARSAEAETSLAWSPDGRHLAFENDSDIWVMSAKGYNERRLTKRFFSFNASWSPDGSVLAYEFFTRLEGPSRSGIAVIGMNGSGRRELTRGNDAWPAWQPARR